MAFLISLILTVEKIIVYFSIMKNYSPKVYLFLLAFLVAHVGMAQNEMSDSLQLFNERFDLITQIFQKDTKRYFEKFSELQLAPVAANATKEALELRKMLLKTKAAMWEQKSMELAKSIFETCLKEMERTNSIPSNDRVVCLFTCAYETEFPGLDYSFFKNVKEKSAKLK